MRRRDVQDCGAEGPECLTEELGEESLETLIIVLFRLRGCVLNTRRGAVSLVMARGKGSVANSDRLAPGSVRERRTQSSSRSDGDERTPLDVDDVEDAVR